MEATLTPWLMQDVFGDIPSPFPQPPSWYRQAACEGSDIDFIEPGSRAGVQAALALCGRCPVRVPCGAYAASEGLVWGVWGGMTEKARAQARKDDRAA